MASRLGEKKCRFCGWSLHPSSPRASARLGHRARNFHKPSLTKSVTNMATRMHATFFLLAFPIHAGMAERIGGRLCSRKRESKWGSLEMAYQAGCRSWTILKGDWECRANGGCSPEKRAISLCFSTSQRVPKLTLNGDPRWSAAVSGH